MMMGRENVATTMLNCWNRQRQKLATRSAVAFFAATGKLKWYNR